MRWRGKRFDFAPSLEELEAAGIELSRREIETGELTPPQMLRYVCEKLEHPFFLSEDALRDLLDQNALNFKWKYDKETQRSWYENELGEFEEPPLLGVYLELPLQTRDWIHPKLGLADGEMGEWEISPREAFETLAQTLSTRDLRVWNAQDQTKFNSHWRHWAQIEVEAERAQIEQNAAAIAAFRDEMNALPHETRAAILKMLRPTIGASPSLANWGQREFIEWNGREIRIFRELATEIDAILKSLE